MEIPILPDMYGQTPLDMCLGINKHRRNEDKIYEKRELKTEETSSARNEALAEVIFHYIKDYSYMHSSQIIHESLIQAVSIGLPSIAAYLESRMIKPEHCFESTTQYKIK